MKIRALGAGLALAALILGGAIVTRSAPSTGAQGATNTIGISSSTTTPSGTTPFTITSSITAAPTAYVGYQVEVSFPDAGLNFVSGTQLQPAGLTLCGTLQQPPPAGGSEFIQSACAKTGAAITFTGPIETYDLACASDGTFAVHLVTLAEDSAFGTTTLDAGAAAIATTTGSDVSITCSGTGGTAVPPTPTDTNTPLATNTPEATATPCPGAPCTPTPVPTAVNTATSLPAAFTRTPTPVGTAKPSTPGAGTTPGAGNTSISGAPTSPGGGPGGANNGPTGRINLPDTGDGTGSGSSSTWGWLLIAFGAVALAATGGSFALLRKRAR